MNHDILAQEAYNRLANKISLNETPLSELTPEHLENYPFYKNYPELYLLVKTIFGEVEGLPESKENTIYVVSAFVAQALAGSRLDIICPDTGKSCVRDERGQIASITQFTTY